VRIDDLFDVGGTDGPEVVTNRIWTIPNILSFVRLAVMPLVYFDIVGDRPLRALVLLIVLASTDWIDGYVARRFGQVTRLGKLLDPISDRILITIVIVALGVAGIVPWWALGVVLLRDVLVAIATVVLATRGRRPPPVSRTGKAATFGLMTVFPLFLLAETVAPGTREAIRGVCFIGLAGSTALYYAAAVGYARALRRSSATPAQ
jgi:cardiolipin synthase